MVKPIVIFALVGFLAGCGPDKVMLMETKFDAPLRQKIASLEEGKEPEIIAVLGKCMAIIDGPMRQSLIRAGADVLSMNGDIFTARVSTDDVFSVAALEFVTQLQLSQVSQPLRK